MALNLSLLRDTARQELLETVQSLRGRKCLVVQSDLGGLLNQIIVEGSKLLKDNGVQHFRELRGELGDFMTDSGRDVPDNIIYLVRPNLSLMKVIANQIHACIKSGIRSQYHIYFVPHRTVVCEQMLEDEGVLEHCEIGEFPLGLVQFDTDLLSLEIDSVFRQCYVDGDTSSLNVVARALNRLQHTFGVIPHVKSKGAASRKVLQKLLHLRREEGLPANVGAFGASGAGGGGSSQRSEIHTLVVLDREVDLVSPMVTPLTYEGLVDDLIGIENGRIKVEASILGDDKSDLTAGPGSAKTQQQQPDKPKRNPNEKVSVPLNNSDSIFAESRNLTIEKNLGAFLQEKAIRIKEKYASFRENKDASISEIHGFVKQIPHLKKEFECLQQHINIAELIKKTTDSREFRDQWQGERGMLEGESFLDQIEDMICADSDRTLFYRTMRLLCLQSLTAGGIRSSRYDAIRRLVVQTYGYEQLFTLSNLERTGLLKRKDVMLVDTAPAWAGLRKQLRLIDERANSGSSPGDISYVSAGYAPLSVRLVQLLQSGSWRAIADVMRLLPGPLLEFTQTSALEELPEALARSNAETAAGSSSSTSSSSTVMATEAASDLRYFAGDDEAGKKVMLVFVVGGLSFMEIAAFRHLSKDPAFPFQIVLGTTKLCSGTGLLKSMSWGRDQEAD